MATVDSSRTGAFRAATWALDHVIDAAVEGRVTHPSGTTFVPADLTSRGRIKTAGALEGGQGPLRRAEDRRSRMRPSRRGHHAGRRQEARKRAPS